MAQDIGDFMRLKNSKKTQQISSPSEQNGKKKPSQLLLNEGLEAGNNYFKKSLDQNKKIIKDIVGETSDLIEHELVLSSDPLIKGVVFSINGLVDKQQVGQFILKTLLDDKLKEKLVSSKSSLLQKIEKQILTVNEVTLETESDKTIHALLSGKSILFIDGIDQAFICATIGGEWRSVEEPTAEIAIRGPKDGFIESMSINISLIRRRIKSPKMKFEVIQLGKVSQTNVAITYMKGIANAKVVQEVRDRLNKIDVDEILSSASVEELIQDKAFTLFPTMLSTERPDVVANSLAEGRIAVIVDGTPFVLIAPVTFSQFFKSAEDYYQRPEISSLIRILRYIAFTLALLGPSLFIALLMFHQDLIPTTLVITLAAQREGIPFPAFIEAFIMEVTFEILREAGLRMPRAIGQAVSIVGALVIGQAAVEAGIVSAAMVIVVAGTAIASFTTPAYNLAVSARILRFGMMILAATMGLYGVTLGLIVLIAHLASLRSFGTPYLAPFAPFIPEDQKDGLFRFPLWSRKKKSILSNENNPLDTEKGLNATQPSETGDTK
ncbi:spore germination protein [Salipaludibacillus neizhouensis]|uniref:Spore germination protein n=2 Tax=Salipaludibacillus neizhouensis TaxID=885475 RepID=A0A3A9K8N1_9BACI|nr:spore germination protein [Salipaludibacillus neizhouensis]